MTFAGIPQAIAYGGISLVTIAHKAITAQSQIVTPLITVTPFAIQTSFPTLISQFVEGFHFICQNQSHKTLNGYVDTQSGLWFHQSIKVTFGAILQYFPIDSLAAHGYLIEGIQ